MSYKPDTELYKQIATVTRQRSRFQRAETDEEKFMKQSMKLKWEAFKAEMQSTE